MTDVGAGGILAQILAPQVGDGPPYTHTLASAGEWQDCSACEGSGGAMVDGEWVDCPTCQGEEGWMVEPPQPPRYTIETAQEDR